MRWRISRDWSRITPADTRGVERVGPSFPGDNFEYSTVAVRATRLSRSIEITVCALNQAGKWMRAVSAALEGIDNARHAGGSDLQNGSNVVVASIKGGSVKIAIRAFDQPGSRPGFASVSGKASSRIHHPGRGLGEFASGARSSSIRRRHSKATIVIIMSATVLSQATAGTNGPITL